MDHGIAGEDEHEDDGWDNEPSGGVFALEPEEDDEEGQSAEELVGRAEERPEEEATFAEVGEFPRGTRGGKSGNESREGDGKKSGTVLGGERFNFELSGEFLCDVALETAGGV